MWSAVEPWRGIFLFAQGQVEGGNARPFGDRRTEVSLEQAGIRLARDPRFVVNVGKLFHPLGSFAPRTFSTRNPLIGVPDTYSPVYPVGAMVSGDVGRMDYRLAAVSLPLTHRDYVPRGGAAMHPVAGVGYTPFTGLRVGATATTGPYLNGDIPASQTAGRAWQSYHLQQIASDIEYGVGHLDIRGEFDYASYDVPTRGTMIGHAGYLEGRYTVTPRLFVAARGEVNHYPFIRPRGARGVDGAANGLQRRRDRSRRSRHRIDADQGQLPLGQMGRDASEPGLCPARRARDRDPALAVVRRDGLAAGDSLNAQCIWRGSRSFTADTIRSAAASAARPCSSSRSRPLG